MSSRKVIVNVTCEEICNLLGIGEGTLNETTRRLSPDDGPQVMAQMHCQAQGLMFKLCDANLPPEFETEEGELITTISLRKMQELSAKHVLGIELIRVTEEDLAKIPGVRNE